MRSMDALARIRLRRCSSFRPTDMTSKFAAFAVILIARCAASVMLGSAKILIGVPVRRITPVWAVIILLAVALLVVAWMTRYAPSPSTPYVVWDRWTHTMKSVRIVPVSTYPD